MSVERLFYTRPDYALIMHDDYGVRYRSVNFTAITRHALAVAAGIGHEIKAYVDQRSLNVFVPMLGDIVAVPVQLGEEVFMGVGTVIVHEGRPHCLVMSPKGADLIDGIPEDCRIIMRDGKLFLWANGKGEQTDQKLHIVGSNDNRG